MPIAWLGQRTGPSAFATPKRYITERQPSFGYSPLAAGYTLTASQTLTLKGNILIQ